MQLHKEALSASTTERQIKRLEAEIAKLREIYASDIHDSFREGQQTQMMIDQYTKQLYRLKQQHLSTDNIENSDKKTFTLMNIEDSSITREFKLVESNPDPANGLISKGSPLGQQLLKAKPGDKIQIGSDSYTLTLQGNKQTTP